MTASGHRFIPTLSPLPAAREDPDRVDRLQRQLAQLQAELADAREQLEARSLVERATGVLIVDRGIDAASAADLLTNWSEDAGISIRELSAAIVANAELSPGLATPAVRAAVGDFGLAE